MGSVVSRSSVLTTASCLGDSQPSIVQLTESGSQHEVDRVLKHPGFNITDRTNDIALIRLKKPLTWSSSMVPICLWTNVTHTPIELDINYPCKMLDILRYSSKTIRFHFLQRKTRITRPKSTTRCTVRTVNGRIHTWSEILSCAREVPTKVPCAWLPEISWYGRMKMQRFDTWSDCPQTRANKSSGNIPFSQGFHLI